MSVVNADPAAHDPRNRAQRRSAVNEAVGLDLVALAALLRSTDQFTPMEVALELGSLEIPAVPTVPGDKDPLLSTKHIRGVDRNGEIIGEACAKCKVAGLTPSADHGATTDPDVIRRYWSAHADAGVGMKNHPQLVRGDGDFETAAELKKARKKIGYGQPGGVPDPCEAHTPGGQYRRRWIHSLPEGAVAPGGGTKILGTSWYGSSGYTVIKGGHPSGNQYPRFYGEITPLPLTIVAPLAERGEVQGAGVAASSAEVSRFLDAHVGTDRLDRLAARRKIVATADVGDRHHTAIAQLSYAFRESVAGWYPARLAHDAFHAALAEAGWDQSRFDGEWNDIVAWAVGQCDKLTRELARAALAAEDYQWRTELAEEAYSDGEQEWDRLHVAPDLEPEEIDRLLAVTDDTDVGVTDDDLESFQAIDVAAYRAGNIEPIMPTTLVTSDGVGLIYTDRLNYIFSGPGAGKSWALAFIVREKVENGETIAVIDVEDTLAPLLERLAQIGVDPAALDRHLLFIHPAAPFTPAAVGLIIDQMVKRGAVHACLDSLGEAFALEGVGENNDDEVGPWVGGVLRRIINQTGAGVTVIDHSTKAGVKEGELTPSGSKRKTAGVTGASWFVKVIKPFVKGQGGKVQFVCAKDRHGNFRRGDACAEMEMAFVLGECMLTLTRLGVADHLDNDYHEQKYRDVKATIVAVLRAHQRTDDPLSKSALTGKVRDKMKASTAIIGEALESLLHADAEHPEPLVIETAGPRNSRLFHAAEVEGWSRGE